MNQGPPVSMAEFLVKVAANYTHADPVINKRGVFQRGDIVTEQEDGVAWGTKDRDSHSVVKVPGMTGVEGHQYCCAQFDREELPGPEELLEETPEIILCRLYCFDTSLLSAPDLIAFDAGTLTMTQPDFEAVLVNKDTGFTVG